MQYETVNFETIAEMCVGLGNRLCVWQAMAQRCKVERFGYVGKNKRTGAIEIVHSSVGDKDSVAPKFPGLDNSDAVVTIHTHPFGSGHLEPPSTQDFIGIGPGFHLVAAPEGLWVYRLNSRITRTPLDLMLNLRTYEDLTDDAVAGLFGPEMLCRKVKKLCSVVTVAFIAWRKCEKKYFGCTRTEDYRTDYCTSRRCARGNCTCLMVFRGRGGRWGTN